MINTLRNVVWGKGKLLPLREVCLLREYINFYEKRERWKLSISAFYKVSHYSHISEIKSRKVTKRLQRVSNTLGLRKERESQKLFLDCCHIISKKMKLFSFTSFSYHPFYCVLTFKNNQLKLLQISTKLNGGTENSNPD